MPYTTLGRAVAQGAIGLLRQQLPPTTRVRGRVTRGGEAPNAIPERTEGRWYVRAETLAELASVEGRVRRGGRLEEGLAQEQRETRIPVARPPLAKSRTQGLVSLRVKEGEGGRKRPRMAGRSRLRRSACGGRPAARGHPRNAG